MAVSAKARVSHDQGHIVDRLHAYMQDHDLGLEEFADLLQTTPKVLAQWLNGTAITPACTLISLCVDSRLQQARVYPSRSKEEALKRVRAI